MPRAYRPNMRTAWRMRQAARALGMDEYGWWSHRDNRGPAMLFYDADGKLDVITLRDAERLAAERERALLLWQVGWLIRYLRLQPALAVDPRGGRLMPLITVTDRDAESVTLKLDRRVVSVLRTALTSDSEVNDRDFLWRDLAAVERRILDGLPLGRSVTMAELSRAFAEPGS